MNVSVDFLRDRVRKRLYRRASVVAAVTLLIAVGWWVRSRDELEKLRADADRARSEQTASERNAAAEKNRQASQLTAEQFRQRYVASLPWVEVLDAVEEVPGLQVTDLRFNVGSGEAWLELVVPDGGEFLKSVEALRSKLPRWNLQVVRETHAEGRITASVELKDRWFPAKK